MSRLPPGRYTGLVGLRRIGCTLGLPAEAASMHVKDRPASLPPPPRRFDASVRALATRASVVRHELGRSQVDHVLRAPRRAGASPYRACARRSDNRSVRRSRGGRSCGPRSNGRRCLHHCPCGPHAARPIRPIAVEPGFDEAYDAPSAAVVPAASKRHWSALKRTVLRVHPAAAASPPSFPVRACARGTTLRETSPAPSFPPTGHEPHAPGAMPPAPSPVRGGHPRWSDSCRPSTVVMSAAT